ncbi:MliC family protein [Albimonas pacifica]|uniref:Membrane-bound lysozyme-inhibitor of c-type lysozyme n=1 Tax=Albimonas pacifica TaxID=1114924 RepID=A0A1I3LRU5_9RHOB|nr:MliC family protein [Albimonas pacifica]SFI87452.1 Protein of unknown function [Albimonas pacifica]
MRALSLALPFLAALPGAPASAADPSFDCAKAEHEVETLICADERLAALDREVARLYGLARNGPHMDEGRAKQLAAYQRGWIKGRNDCWKAGPEDAAKIACTAGESMIRILELRQGYFDARQDDDAGISGGPMALDCEGWAVGVGFAWAVTDPGMAAIQWMDATVALEQAMAASGVRYVGTSWDGDYELWTKGDEAMLTIPGRETMTCRIEEIG